MDTTLVQQLEQTGIDLLNFGKQSAQQLFAFVEKEAPLLLQEWMNWNFVISLVWFCLCLIVVLLVLFTIYKSSKNEFRIIEETEGAIFIFWIVVPFVSFVIMCFNVDWLQIWIAPRVWLLENIKTLLN